VEKLLTVPITNGMEYASAITGFITTRLADDRYTQCHLIG